MKKKINSIVFALVASAVMYLGSNSTAYAVELTNSNFDGAGNYYSAGEVVNTSSDCVNTIDNECFLAGQKVEVEDAVIDGSAFIAGANVNIKNSTVGSSIFAAGSDVSIDASANNNMWIFGANVSLSDDTSVRGLHAAGANLDIEGEYDQVSVCGETVIFNAKVDGDVNIDAENVTIGDDAEVTGEINVTYSKLLHQESGASVPNLNVTKVETSEDSQNLAKVAIGSIIARKVKSAFYLLFSNSVLAVLLALLFNSSLKKSYEYCTKRTGSFIGFGALVACMMPTAILLALITWIGAPTAGIALMIYMTVGFICKVFTFGSLVREFIFTHTSKRLHPVAETVLAVLPLAVIRQIPFVKGLVGLACMIYTCGYIVLAIYDKLQAEKNEKTEVIESTPSNLE